jgi:hypothetical protein
MESLDLVYFHSVVRNMETQVHELIEARYRRYPQWNKCYDPELRELNCRLEKVE